MSSLLSSKTPHLLQVRDPCNRPLYYQCQAQNPQVGTDLKFSGTRTDFRSRELHKQTGLLTSLDCSTAQFVKLQLPTQQLTQWGLPCEMCRGSSQWIGAMSRTSQFTERAPIRPEANGPPICPKSIQGSDFAAPGSPFLQSNDKKTSSFLRFCVSAWGCVPSN